VEHDWPGQSGLIDNYVLTLIGKTNMDRTEQKQKRRLARSRNLAHKQSPYNKKGHSHKTPRDYRRTEKYPVYYDAID